MHPTPGSLARVGLHADLLALRKCLGRHEITVQARGSAPRRYGWGLSNFMRTPWQQAFQPLKILVADPDDHMRRITRVMLSGLGARTVMEADDGVGALELTRSGDPDLLVTEWNMPLLNGEEILRIVRSPGIFPRPELPVVVLTHHTERSCVLKALRVGVHEFVAKPTSPKALADRMLCAVTIQRPFVKLGDYFVPQPRPRCAFHHLGFQQQSPAGKT